MSIKGSKLILETQAGQPVLTKFLQALSFHNHMFSLK